MATKKLQILGNLGNKIYTQDEEPVGVQEGALWLDTDEAVHLDFSNMVDASLTKAKASGEFDGEQGEDGRSIHACTYDGVLESTGEIRKKMNDTFDNSYFPNSNPQDGDLFVTASGYVGYIEQYRLETESITDSTGQWITGDTYECVEYSLVADLNGGDGKSVYDYAVEAGYEGTEEEFAEMLANGVGGGSEQITDTVLITDNLFDNNFDESGYITASGNAESENFKRTSKYYELPNGENRKIYIATSETVSPFAVMVYDADKKYITSYIDGQNISNSAKYFRVYTRSEFTGNGYVSTIPYGDPVDYSYEVRTMIKDEALEGTNLQKEVNGLYEEIDNLPFEDVVTSDNLFDNNFDVSGYYLYNGVVTVGSDWRYTSKYYALPKDKIGGNLHVRQSIANEQLYIATYEENGSYLETYSTKDVSYDIQLHRKAKLFRLYRRKACTAMVYVSSVIPNDAVNYAYVRESVSNEKPLLGKKVVCFGDSIFGMFRGVIGYDISIPQIIADKTGASCFNVGFGGCRMTPHEPPYDPFSMYNLADAIVSGDWTTQDNSVATYTGLPSYFSEHLERLKRIKWENIDILTIAYGTNDYTASQPIDATEGTFDKEYEYYKGALHYSIEKLLTAYPHLKIVVVTPTYRWFLDAALAYSHDCDDEAAKNDLAYLLKDYVAACKEVCEKYHIHCVDNFSGIGMNKYNRLQYFDSTDGTHPKREGRTLLAQHIADELLRYK